MVTHIPKPAELVDRPPDGSGFARRVPAPLMFDFRLGEIVTLTASGEAARLSGSETTGFYLVVKDNTPGLPEGSFLDNYDGSWFAKKPEYIDVIPVSGRLVILNAWGMVTASHIGARRPLFTSGDGYTFVNIGGTGTAARILQVVEGRIGDMNPRVLVELS
jgi:hypothetical protein